MMMKEKKIMPGDIYSITVSTYAVAAMAVGKGVPDGGSFVSAQFSIPYVVAACILDGALGPLQLTERRIADPAVIALAEKVKVKSDDELNRMYPDKTASRVEILLKNGERLTRQIDIPKGDPRDPMEADDVASKVKFFSGNRDPQKIERIIDEIMNLEKAKNIRDLASLI
jgi:2-methylcitrate dehydratase PrpD